MKILIIGSSGQLGIFLSKYTNKKENIIQLDRSNLDLQDHEGLKNKILEISPNIVINAAAYTSVDDAEHNKQLCFSINHTAVEIIATACKKINSWLIHISSDYVFDGNTKTLYLENSNPNPINIYGLSKLKGDEEILRKDLNYILIRTSWVYSEYGKNFLKTIFLNGLTKESLNIVNDQVGSPTYAGDLAKFILEVVSKIRVGSIKRGIYNFCGDSSCSWFEFAESIKKIAIKNNYKFKANINPISSKDLNFEAKRPCYSALNFNKIKSLGMMPSNIEKGIESAILNISI